MSPADAAAIVRAARAAIAFERPSSQAELWPALFALLWWTGRRLGEVLSVTPANVATDHVTYQPGHVLRAG